MVLLHLLSNQTNSLHMYTRIMVCTFILDIYLHVCKIILFSLQMSQIICIYIYLTRRKRLCTYMIANLIIYFLSFTQLNKKDNIYMTRFRE